VKGLGKWLMAPKPSALPVAGDGRAAKSIQRAEGAAAEADLSRKALQHRTTLHVVQPLLKSP
jgi:hypothetical protein